MNFFAFQVHDMGTLNWVLDGRNGYGWAKDVLAGWERRIKARNPRAVSALFLSNHDQGRSFYQFGGNDIDGDARRKMAAALYLLSPGTPFIYYGEEIGLADFPEPGGVHEDSDHRGPMWWSNTDQYGTPSPPEKRDWPVKAPPSGRGVDEQIKDPSSLLSFYIKIINLKNKYPWFAYAHNIEAQYLADGRIAAYRVANPDKPEQTVLLVQNTDKDTTMTIQIPRAVTHYASASVFGNQDNDKDWKAAAGTSFDVFGYSTVIFQEY
jgi:alpha-amylase